jgi:FO synthase subunit 2
MEVAYAAQKSGWSTVDVLNGMKHAGLHSLCGTAAEILVDAVRKKICAQKTKPKAYAQQSGSQRRNRCSPERLPVGATSAD